MLRAKLVPAEAIAGMQRDGAGFAGFATWLDMTPAHPDLFARPDPESLIQLPWKPEVGWLAGDLWMDGKEVDRQPARAAEEPGRDGRRQGLPHEDGVECEYFLDHAGRKSVADVLDSAGKALLRPEAR